MSGLRAAPLSIPVEEVIPGDVVVLPNGKQVEVYEIARYGDEYVVRWHAGGVYRRPHPLAGQHAELGSLVPRVAGETVPLDRRAAG